MKKKMLNLQRRKGYEGIFMTNLDKKTVIFDLD